MEDSIKIIKWIKVLTPKEEEIFIGSLEKEEMEKAIRIYRGKKLESNDLKHINRPIFILNNGKVIHVKFFSGFSHIYNSLEDFKKCNDFQSYLSFGITYYENSSIERFYDFELKPNEVKRQFENNEYILDTNYNHKQYSAFMSRMGYYMYLSKPHLNTGYWFLSKEMFQKFHPHFHSNKEYLPSEEVLKKIKIRNKTFEILRLSLKKATPYLQNIASEIFNFKNYDISFEYKKAYKLIDEKVLFRWDDDIFLLFNNEQDFITLTEANLEDNYPLNYSQKRNFQEIVEKSNFYLSQMLDIDINKLDYSFKSLEEIDEIINNYFLNEDMIKEVLIHIIAYFGNTIINIEEQCHWDFVKLKREEKYEPIIVFNNEEKIYFSQWIIHELEEQEYSYKSCISCIYVSLFAGIKIDKKD